LINTWNICLIVAASTPVCESQSGEDEAAAVMSATDCGLTGDMVQLVTFLLQFLLLYASCLILLFYLAVIF
jgi:hypothetical protein